MSDEFDLDGLLEESVDLQKRARQQRDSQKAGQKGRPQEKTVPGWMNKEEIEAHVVAVQKIKARSEGWEKVSGVLLIHAQICSHCGSEHQHVEGIFLKRTNPKLRLTNLVKPDGMIDIAGLPKEVEIRTASMPICANCCDSQGWSEAARNII